MLDAMDVTHRLSLNRETRRKKNDGEQGPSHPTARHPGAGRDLGCEAQASAEEGRAPDHASGDGKPSTVQLWIFQDFSRLVWKFFNQEPQQFQLIITARFPDLGFQLDGAWPIRSNV